ncbi:hypothetical protein Tco_0409289 [Tanacetum coccineum]
METHKPLLKDADGEDIDEHIFQVNPKVSHLHAVKRIFRYLKGQPKLGLWYPKDSPFYLVAYIGSDYAGASLDKESTIGGCQFLGYRLISWQCKKQTVVANSTTETKYIVASNCCGQVLWIQNQLLDYGYNFMHTKIHIDNESTICIVKIPVFHSKTKHIEIRYHFIRDSNEKKLIQILGMKLELVLLTELNAAKLSAATTTTTTAITEVELTLAQALAELRNTKPKKKDQEKLDKEVAAKLQAEFDEEARLAREEVKKLEQANIALISSWDDVQAKIEADQLLAERLQAREQEQFTGAKKLKGFKFEVIKDMFDKAFKSVNTFVDMNTELVKGSETRAEGSSKRAGEDLQQESSKKQKVDDDKEKKELKQCFEIVLEEEIAIDAIPLATKPVPIVNFHIHRKGRNGYYKIMRANGSAKTYLLFSQLLKEFDKEDLENLWKLVKDKHGYKMPEEAYERVLWGDLKVMFEPHVEDAVWRNI